MIVLVLERAFVVETVSMGRGLVLELLSVERP